MENQFSVMDVVWARARKPKSEIFWPAQVIENIGGTGRSLKKIIASVRFLGEDTEDDVKNPKDIKKWDCEEQSTFIQKGRSSLKDSNTKISFNKGIKEARKLVKENSTASKESKNVISSMNNNLVNCNGEKGNTTRVKFIDDKVVSCSTSGKSYEIPTVQSACSEMCNVKGKKQTPLKRGRKRSAKKNLEESNDNININTVCDSLHVEESCHGRRKSPRKKSASDSTKKVCKGETADNTFSQKGSNTKSSLQKSPRQPPEKVIENKSESVKEIRKQGKRKREEQESKDSLTLLCEDLQQETCSLDSTTETKATLVESKKQKGKRQLFPKQLEVTSSCEEEIWSVTKENGNSVNVINGESIEMKTEYSDSDESSDKELMETALDSTPSSKNLKFALNDVVWAKLNRDPYWPGQVKRIQRKTKKIYVKFLGCNDKRSFSCKKLHPYACDVSKRQEFTSEGLEVDPSNFQNALTEAEDLVRKKALGISTGQDDDEDFELVDNEEPKQETQAPIVAEITEEENREKEDVRRSKRSRKQITKYNRDMLSYIREAKPILREILEEKRPCERHKIFTTGKSKAKSALRCKSGFGPISDSELENEIAELLMEFYNEVSLKKDDLSRSTYVMDVWLPEAIIYAIQKIDHIDRDKAELIFNKGTSESCNFTHAELIQQLKAKPLSDEDRQAVIERAERQFKIQNKDKR